MEAHLPFATLPALLREIRVAAGASSSTRLLKAAAKGGACGGVDPWQLVADEDEVGVPSTGVTEGEVSTLDAWPRGGACRCEDSELDVRNASANRLGPIAKINSFRRRIRARSQSSPCRYNVGRAGIVHARLETEQDVGR
jgi:hypothetical protein